METVCSFLSTLRQPRSGDQVQEVPNVGRVEQVRFEGDTNEGDDDRDVRR